MTEQRIEADVIYQHEKYGDVLVTGIAKMYGEWDVTDPSNDIESIGNVLVFFYDDYDGYGGLQPMPLSENINEFSKKVSREAVFEYEDVSKLKEDH